MHTPAEILNIVEDTLKKEQITKPPQKLYDPVNYILSLGGKRIRPVMTLMACEMFGGELEKALPAAMGIEMFHNFSLVHDDIMDRAPLRRGKSTVHEKWDANAAILSGDTMLVLAYEFFLRLEKPLIIPAVTVFSRTAKEVCEGQQFDMDFECDPGVSIEQYLEMIRLKTAVLIGASFELGGIVAGAGEDAIRDIYDFGVNAGLAFQLMDDLLDTYGDEKIFGKKLHGDIRSNKKTFLYLKAMELADRGQSENLKKYYSGSYSDSEEKVDKVTRIFHSLNVKGHTEGMIAHFHAKALECFSRIDIDNSRKQGIQVFIENLMDRKH